MALKLEVWVWLAGIAVSGRFPSKSTLRLVLNRGPVELSSNGEYEAPRLVKDHAEGVYVGLLVV